MNTLLTIVSLTATTDAGFDWVKAIVIALGVGLMAAFITAMSLKGQLTSVYKNDSAADYTKSGSFKVETKRDTFLYSKTEKEAKPQNSSNNG